MSVATMLGVDDVNSPAMIEARRSWDRWVAIEPSLAVVDDLLSLREWTCHAEREDKDAAIRALAKLGSPTGAADPAATTALTWALVPGAASLARQLFDLSSNIDELVASYLWTSAKTFDWERRRSAAASILRDTRRSVLAELGVGEWARRQDHAWSATVRLEPSSPAWQHVVDEPSDQMSDDAVTDLLELLEGATWAGVITVADRKLLVDLAIAADKAGVAAGRGRAGMTAPAATDVVANRSGMTPRSVRRRASKSIDRLAAYCGVPHRQSLPAVATCPEHLALGA